jgi:hypothetical protein
MTWKHVREVDLYEPTFVVDLAAVAERRELAAVAADPQAFKQELARLTLRAVDPLLAELIALAEQPLDLSEQVGDAVDDEDVERAVAALVKQGEVDLADHKAGRLSTRPRRQTSAKGRPPKSFSGYSVSASTVAAAPPLPRRRRGRGRVVVDGVRGRALTASGQLIEGGFEAVLRRLARRG